LPNELLSSEPANSTRSYREYSGGTPEDCCRPTDQAAGLLDGTAYAKSKGDCRGGRFAPDEEAVDGRLARKGSRWFFDYDNTDDADDEPVHRLGEHRFATGEYVTVTDEDGRPLTYKVMEVTAI